MSGGHFDYKQCQIEQMADDIADLIAKTESGQFLYSDETLEKFKQAEKTLRQAYIMAQRIDWLVSDDDGEDSFHARWKEDLAKLERGRR